MYEQQPLRDDLGTLKIMFEEVPQIFTDRVKKNYRIQIITRSDHVCKLDVIFPTNGCR